MYFTSFKHTWFQIYLTFLSVHCTTHTTSRPNIMLSNNKCKLMTKLQWWTYLLMYKDASQRHGPCLEGGGQCWRESFMLAIRLISVSTTRHRINIRGCDCEKRDTLQSLIDENKTTVSYIRHLSHMNCSSVTRKKNNITTGWEDKYPNKETNRWKN